MNKKIGNWQNYLPETLILLLAFFTRFFRLDIPHAYVFDEVYHAFTAEQMFKGNPAAWEWWNTPPKGFAYEWTHPPLAKEFMVIAIRIFGDNSFSWRFFSAFFGVFVIALIYLIAFKIFKNRFLALIAAFLATLDGLLLTMSRIAMNDIYLVFFLLLAFYLFLNKKYLFMSISIGFAAASKWTGFFADALLLGFYLSLQLKNLIKIKRIEEKLKLASRVFLKSIFLFLVIPVLIYIASYLPFFAGKHYAPGLEKSNITTFINLQQQMYWYHTNLKAHHTYESKPVQWLFDLRPVWFYVDYKDTTLANIYNLGNPIFMWVGFSSIIFLFAEFIKNRKKTLVLIIIPYLIFFLPWLFSPRIMFYYHYLPSVPFLAISLAYLLSRIFEENKKGKIIVVGFLILVAITFIYFLPLWTAIPVPREIYNTYFWLKTWK
jgi:dolichyl-phosphate-mannose--protein O-mannosyl transferase